MEDNLDLTKNPELNAALEEFEAKVIEPEKKETVSIEAESDSPKIVQLLIKCSDGTINERQAEYVLLGLVIAMMLLSGYLVFGNKNKNNVIPPDSSAFNTEFIP